MPLHSWAVSGRVGRGGGSGWGGDGGGFGGGELLHGAYLEILLSCKADLAEAKPKPPSPLCREASTFCTPRLFSPSRPGEKTLSYRRAAASLQRGGTPLPSFTALTPFPPLRSPASSLNLNLWVCYLVVESALSPVNEVNAQIDPEMFLCDASLSAPPFFSLGQIARGRLNNNFICLPRP